MVGALGGADLVSIVEAVYRVEERAPAAWLRGILEQTRGAIGRGHAGVYGLDYDASDPRACRFSNLVMLGVEDPRLVRLLEVDCPALYRNPAFVEAVFRRIPYGPSQDLPLGNELVSFHAKLRALRIQTILGVNGVNVDGRGAHVGVLVRRASSAFDPSALPHLATHLAAAFRLRARLREADVVARADAVLEPTGKIAHAVREAKVRSARMELAKAAANLDSLRSRGRRRNPERALRAWRALVDGRWSLVDHFEENGRRYVLAQRNDPDVAPMELLSDRERQVVALAALGHPNKMIAYELGIAVSTVGVLLTRAGRRTGAKSRRELIAAYAEQMRRTAVDEG